MRATLHSPSNLWPIQRQNCAGATRARHPATAKADRSTGELRRQTGRRTHVAAVRRWAREFSCRLATNRHVFYGALLLAASLIVGAITSGHAVWWRSAAALGIGVVVIGLVHAWLDARADRRRGHAHSRGREKVL